MKTFAIIGGGAAGMMAAVALKEVASEAEVLLFEKNHYLGAKVIISGGGRCNVTTGICDVRKLLENYPRGAKFLMSAMFRFPPDKVMQWFEEHGVRLKTQEDLRVFPRSNNGKDIVGALEKTLRDQSVQIILKAQVVKITLKDGKSGHDDKSDNQGDIHNKKFEISLKDGSKYGADSVILTTGGNAYRQTGSTGDGYAFAKSLGHTLTELRPSLHSFVAAEKWLVDLAGVGFEKAVIVLSSYDGERVYKRTGSFLFTHQGVTGPAIFAISSQAAYEDFDLGKPMLLSINFFPDESMADLEKHFCALANEHGKKRLINFVDLFLPKSLCGLVLKLADLKPDMVVGQLTKQQRQKLLKLWQNFSLQVVGRGAGDEFVTAGGISLSEVNTNTMESKICSGLYFAGEILDIDGFTGGFNLQASWATGRLAGESMGSINRK